MIRKTMFLGEYAAEFHLDHKSEPARYNYAIVRRESRTLLFWGRGTSVPELMSVALDRLQRCHSEQSAAESASDAAEAELASRLKAAG